MTSQLSELPSGKLTQLWTLTIYTGKTLAINGNFQQLWESLPEDVCVPQLKSLVHGSTTPHGQCNLLGLSRGSRGHHLRCDEGGMKGGLVWRNVGETMSRQITKGSRHGNQATSVQSHVHLPSGNPTQLLKIATYSERSHSKHSKAAMFHGYVSYQRVSKDAGAGVDSCFDGYMKHSDIWLCCSDICSIFWVLKSEYGTQLIPWTKD